MDGFLSDSHQLCVEFDWRVACFVGAIQIGIARTLVELLVGALGSVGDCDRILHSLHCILSCRKRELIMCNLWGGRSGENLTETEPEKLVNRLEV